MRRTSRKPQAVSTGTGSRVTYEFPFVSQKSNMGTSIVVVVSTVSIVAMTF